MKKYKCTVCGYIYDPGQNNDIDFDGLPDDWDCPDCGISKDQFELMKNN